MKWCFSCMAYNGYIIRFKSLAFTWLGWTTLHFQTSMIDFIQISTWHLYIWKAANKTVFIKTFSDKTELKHNKKTVEPNRSHSSLLFSLSPQDCNGIFNLPSLACQAIQRPYKQAMSFSNWHLYNPLVGVVLQSLTHILWTSPAFWQGNM